MERKQEVEEEEEEESDTHNEAELKELEESIAANPQDSSLRFRLGLLLWEQGSDFKEKAAEQFVISAKLNPENAETFRFLGHYYDGVSGDVQRAQKCYQRAVTLNPDDSISGEALCDLLDQAGKESLELAVCNDASERSPRAFWAFRRLGFLNIHRGRISEAIQTLQHAIRGYPTCPDSWEALGLSYQRLGMYTAAIKAFGRAIELDESRIIALVESGNIFLMLGSFRKGIEHFQRALEISPQNVSANYGLASGLLGLAKECVNLGAFRWAASLLEDALNVAKANARLAGNLSSNWKLLGDIQLQYAKCFPWTEEDRSIESNVEIFKDSVLSWKRTCHSSAISARRSYQLALHLAPWQANLYFDIAITSDLISTFNENHEQEIEPWQLSEKMAFGALLLEGNNYEFWVALGCLSGQYSMRQHALIRALQLDVSLAAAWAYLGKLYREEAEMKLAKQAFDCARSIDPSLALPWAGMSADTRFGEAMLDEAFESCLRAVQISPLADFQIGLAKLALLSGNITSSQVLGAIRQAVERAPHHPESHNLKGLVCEARADYHAAISSYKLARFALKTSLEDLPKSHFRDVAINLARSLSKAGYYAETVQECESLKKAGIIDVEGLQIYAFSLSELGQNELARTVVRDLAARVLTMEWNAAATSVSLIFRLMYHISGKDSAISSIQKMPKELLQTPKVSFIVFAIHSLDQSNQLASAVSTSQYSISSHEEIIGMHYLISLSKLVKNRSENCLGFQSGILHLKKVLHMYPNSISLRNLLGHLLISSEEWKDNHLANKCCIMGGTYTASKEGLRTGCEILGAGSIACYTVGNKDPKFSFPTCGYQCSNEPQTVQELQRYLHQEPWNRNARYLLTLHLLQQAREERFPWNLCVILKRLLSIALSSEIYSRRHMSFQYQKFQLLLCASEISLQSGDLRGCLQHANGASLLPLPNNYLFFSHLLLCRAYAAEGNHTKLEEEYIKCLDLKTDYRIGWICLKMIECQYRLHSDANLLELSFEEGSKEWENSWNLWMAVFNLVLGLASLMNQDFVSAEESFARGCNLAGVDSCLHLCHGAACMELARKLSSSEFLTLAVRSLTKARANFVTPLPLVSLLLAQAEGSLGSKEKWEKNLRHEWYTWPPEMRPAELFFQMHLLARQSKARKDSVEFCQSPEKWVLRAIHMNPSGSKYWKVLYKLLNECQTMQGL